jgi:mono/diheme cytochrome c family protein
MFSIKLMAPFFAGALLAGSVVHAQEMTLGKMEYQNSCVACHGASGKGDGPVTDFLSGAVVPDLTVLQKNNGGVFPVTAVFETIDGSDIASAHGTRDMPIWGTRLRERASNDPDFPIAEAEGYTQIRILALIEYIASLQEQ